eukprot:Clim_evm9s229 gene=Clim_evmTU9s229
MGNAKELEHLVRHKLEKTLLRFTAAELCDHFPVCRKEGRNASKVLYVDVIVEDAIARAQGDIDAQIAVVHSVDALHTALYPEKELLKWALYKAQKDDKHNFQLPESIRNRLHGLLKPYYNNVVASTVVNGCVWISITVVNFGGIAGIAFHDERARQDALTEVLSGRHQHKRTAFLAYRPLESEFFLGCRDQAVRRTVLTCLENAFALGKLAAQHLSGDDLSAMMKLRLQGPDYGDLRERKRGLVDSNPLEPNTHHKRLRAMGKHPSDTNTIAWVATGQLKMHSRVQTALQDQENRSNTVVRREKFLDDSDEKEDEMTIRVHKVTTETDEEIGHDRHPDLTVTLRRKRLRTWVQQRYHRKQESKVTNCINGVDIAHTHGCILEGAHSLCTEALNAIDVKLDPSLWLCHS